MDVASLFSGCGGTDLGFEKAGCELIWANDFAKWPVETYSKNFGFNATHADVTTVLKFPRADILVGCYPCQGFSQYGKKNPNDSRNYLYLQFARALKQSKPKYFVAENVKGLLFSYAKPIFNDMLKRFSQKGYCVHWKLVNAKEYGVPQDRQRVFIVGIRKGLNKDYFFPEPTHGPGLKPYTTIKQALSDLPRVKKDELFTGSYSSHYLSRNRKRKWNEVSYTIQANGRHVPLHPSGKQPVKVGKDKYILPSPISSHRRFSFWECARIQTFPDNFEFLGPLSAKYEQIGNAVPPLLAEKIADSLLDL